MLAILLEVPLSRLERLLDHLGEGELTSHRLWVAQEVLGLPIPPLSYLAFPRMGVDLGCQPREVRELLKELEL